ncbi:MAG: esterase family protein, partial [Anaerolineae bacterium]|nr:esterase family protein [Anaerolineae bacterium]
MSLLERAKGSGNPLIEGTTATFVWEGDTPPILAGDFTGWRRDFAITEWRQEADYWVATVMLPKDGYVEYAFFSADDDDARVRDPLNNQRTWNGVNNYNHNFYMPEAGPSPLLRVRRGVPRGTVTRYEIESHWISARKTRPLYLYEPPNATAPYPLMVVWDGPDYLRRGRLTQIVDNLI